MLESQPFYKNPKNQRAIISFSVIFILIIAFSEELRYITNTIYSLIRTYILNQPSILLPRNNILLSFYILLIAAITFILFNIFLLLLISSYLLPIQNFKEQLNVIYRLILYDLRMHGPAIFIKSGYIVAKAEELKRPGQGVIMVDSSSAVVIERKNYIKTNKRGDQTPKKDKYGKKKDEGKDIRNYRVEGPGIVFIKDEEQIKESVDLRTQFRMRPQVNATTVDGIEISTNIFTIFTLGEKPDLLYVTYDGESSEENVRVIYRSGTRDQFTPTAFYTTKVNPIFYELRDELDPEDKAEIHRKISIEKSIEILDPRELIQSQAVETNPHVFYKPNVFSAVVSQAINQTYETYTPWMDLPADVATQIFREMISRQTYNHLYEPTQPNQYPISNLKHQFSRRVRNQGVINFQFVRKKNGNPIRLGDEWDMTQLQFYEVQELETPKILRTRGIKIIRAGFTELSVDPEIYKQLREPIIAGYQREADRELVSKEYWAFVNNIIYRRQNMREITHYLMQILDQGKYTEEALVLQLFQSLDAAAADPRTKVLIPGETINLLKNIHDWLLPEKSPEPPTLGDRPVNENNPPQGDGGPDN